MNIRCLIPLFAFLLFFSTVYSQQKLEKLDFSDVDKFAKTVKYDENIQRLTKELTSPYTKDIYKLRAIFIWVTQNIDYDIESFNSKSSSHSVTFNCKTPAECEEKKQAYEDERVATVLRNHKGVCSGYSALMVKMCTIAGVKCEVVNGYSKTKSYEVGIPLNENHAWNAVILDGNYYFLDATWAAGGCFVNSQTDKLSSFKRNFNNYYWLTPNEQFFRNHYPTNPKWLFKAEYNKQAFFDAPYYSPELIGNINLISPNSGVLQVKAGDTVHFKFTDKDNFNCIQTNYTGHQCPMLPFRRLENNEIVLNIKDSSFLNRGGVIPFTHKENLYEFDFIVPKQTIYFIELMLDFRSALKFRVDYQIN